MPITVVSQPITWVGPGAGFILQTDFIGPFATGTTWRIEIHAHGDETNAGVVITAPIWPTDNHERRVWLDADPDGGQQTLYSRYVGFGTGQSVDLLYQLLAPDGTTVIDSGATTAVQWDTNVSQNRLLPSSTAALTPEQATELSETHAATHLTLAGLPTFGLGDLLQWFGPLTKPPPGLQVRELIGDFEGNHSFVRPAPGVGVNAFGITWEVQTYGGGIGLDTGTPVRFEVDLLEISTDHTDHDGHEFTSGAFRYNYSNAYHWFDPSFPTRVNVSVAPSVTIRFWWILATFP